jgi:predicted DNA-binding protein
MAATRTQIYLTSAQRERLDALGHREGKALAELVREAVDEYLGHALPDPRQALDATFGALPDLDVPSREEWDRA